MDSEKPSTVIIQRGNYFLGRNSRDGDGNVTQVNPPKWEADPNGSAVVVSLYDDEKNEQIGTGDIFPIWDSHGLDKRVREMLALPRGNFPSPAEIYKWTKEWDDRDIEFCEICEGICAGYDCSICPIKHIKDEQEDEA